MGAVDVAKPTGQVAAHQKADSRDSTLDLVADPAVGPIHHVDPRLDTEAVQSDGDLVTAEPGVSDHDARTNDALTDQAPQLGQNILEKDLPLAHIGRSDDDDYRQSASCIEDQQHASAEEHRRRLALAMLAQFLGFATIVDGYGHDLRRGWRGVPVAEIAVIVTVYPGWQVMQKGIV